MQPPDRVHRPYHAVAFERTRRAFCCRRCDSSPPPDAHRAAVANEPGSVYQAEYRRSMPDRYRVRRATTRLLDRRNCPHALPLGLITPSVPRRPRHEFAGVGEGLGPAAAISKAPTQHSPPPDRSGSRSCVEVDAPCPPTSVRVSKGCRFVTIQAEAVNRKPDPTDNGAP